MQKWYGVMKHIPVAFSSLLCLLIGASSSFALGPKSPAEQLLNDIRERGGKVVLLEKFDSPEWRLITEAIASGDREWLSVANELRTFSDAASSEDLDISLGLALSRHPARVFRSMKNRSDDESVKWICGSEPIDEDRSAKDTLQFFEKRREVVAAVVDKVLAHKRDVCLGAIQDVLERVTERREKVQE